MFWNGSDDYGNAVLHPRWKRFLIALLVVPAIQLLSSALLPAHAGGAAVSAADNTLILTSAALVLLMTPGLAFFYGGFVQVRNVLNTMAMSFVMMGIATLVWASFGFSLAFSDGGALNAVVGNPFSFALLENIPDIWDGLAIPGLTFALFQGMFAIITPALISGALVERISFRFWCLFGCWWSTPLSLIWFGVVVFSARTSISLAERLFTSVPVCLHCCWLVLLAGASSGQSRFVPLTM